MPWKINNYDYWRPNVNKKFDSIWGNKLGKTQHTVAMDRNLENYDFGLKDANVKILKKNTDNVIKSHKCNQCNYTSAQACHLRHHLKTHSGEKPNKCNQCDYASSQKSALRRHLLTHSGKNQTNATNATIHLLMQAFWGDTWKRTVEKRQTNAINATMPLLKQAIWGDICKRTAEKNQTTAINATMHLHR